MIDLTTIFSLTTLAAGPVIGLGIVIREQLKGERNVQPQPKPQEPEQK